MPQEPALVVPNDLIAEIQALKATIANQETRIKALESQQAADEERFALDIAHDRQRITKLEQIKPQPLQKDRGEILSALIAANGGKMLAKEARQKMRLSRSQFSQLLATMKDYVEIKPYQLKKNQNILALK